MARSSRLKAIRLLLLILTPIVVVVTSGRASTAQAESTQFFDPRYSTREIHYLPIHGYVVIEKDIVLGSESEVRASFVGYVQAMSQTTMNIQGARVALTGAQQVKIAAVAALTPQQTSNPDATSLKAARDANRIIERLLTANDEAAGNLQQHSSTLGGDMLKKYLWPGGVLPYIIDKSCLNKTQINDAIDHWHSKTDRIRLVDISKSKVRPENWICFKTLDGMGCSSRVGKQPSRGEQLITVEYGCKTPQIIHEIGHAVGLFHEHSRNDRDKFLSIETQNIDAKMLYNFDLNRDSVDVGDFDFDSIMLYPPRSFSKNQAKPFPAMRKKGNPNDLNWGIFTGSLGGKTRILSAGDLRGVESLYPNPVGP